MSPVTPALKLRVFAASALTILMAGCAQQQLLATATKNDCSKRFWGERDKYTLLRSFTHGPRSITLAVIKAKNDQQEIAFKVAVKTFGKPAAERLPADAELAKAKDELSREKAEAEAVNRKLDEIEAQVDAGRWQMGDCFAVGYDGNQAAKTYNRAKKAIADQRKFVTRDLDRVLEKHRVVAERVAFVERWRADNASHLKRNAGNADLEIVEVARLESFGRVTPRVSVTATNITSSTILRPRNHRVWGYDVHPKLGGSKPIGTSLSDSFGNTFKLIWVKPTFYGTEGRGIRPGETMVFEIEFADMPLENAKSVRIAVEPGAYGQNQRAVFDIPAEVFFRGMVGRSQNRR